MKAKLSNIRATGRRKLVPRNARKTHGKRTRFQLRTIAAHEVFLAGDFNGWNPKSIPLQRENDGHWSVEIELPPGRHEYLFVVDGVWEPDPAATTASNPFGGVNSVVNVGIQSGPDLIPQKRLPVMNSDLPSNSIPRVPDRWKWHHRVLSALRDQLITECNDRRHDAAQSDGPMDFGESATENFDHERALSELRCEEDALGEVTAALRRIEDGTYGVCQRTGRRIPDARLRALPWTRYSQEVQARLEATKARRAPSS